jgi:hypothetical protein
MAAMDQEALRSTAIEALAVEQSGDAAGTARQIRNIP